MTIAYRPATAEEARTFVVASWSASMRTAFTSGFIQDEDYFEIMDAQVAKALARPDVRAVVACASSGASAGSDLLGFIVADTDERPPLVYYVYVKEHYRRGGAGRLWAGPGIARGLFAAIGVDPEQPFSYVCSTPMCRTLQRKIPLARWQPLLGRFPKSERRNRR